MEQNVPGSPWLAGLIVHDIDLDIVTLNGVALELDRNSRAVLIALLEAGGAPVSKSQLLKAGWPGRTVHENSLAKAIGRIRRSLGEEGKRIEAIYGQGYCLQTNLIAATEPALPPPAAPDQGTLPDSGPVPRPASRWLARLTTRRTAIIASTVGALLAGMAILLSDSETQSREHDNSADELIAWLSSDFIAASDPYNSANADSSLHALVDKTAATMDERYAGRPDALVALHRLTANAYSGWGEYQKAVFHLDAAADLEAKTHGRATELYAQLSTALCQQLRLDGRTGRAKAVCQTAVDLASKLSAPILAEARVAQAKLFFETGEYEKASSILSKIIRARPPSDPAVEADAYWYQGLSLRKLGRLAEAQKALRHNLEIREKTLGKDHPLTAWAFADYGDLMIDTGNFAEAETMLRKGRSIFVKSLGENHPEALSPQYSLGVLRNWEGKPEEARVLLEPILVQYRRDLGSDHFWTLYTLTELALAEAQSGRPRKAEQHLNEARNTGARTLYGLNAKAVYFHIRWSRTLLALGQVSAAEKELQLAGSLASHHLASNHFMKAQVHCLKAEASSLLGDIANERSEADACAQELRAANLPDKNPLWTKARRFSRTVRGKPYGIAKHASTKDARWSNATAKICTYAG